MNYNRIIDSTLLKANAIEKDIEKLCSDAVKYRFYSVCVNPANVSLCAKFLQKFGTMKNENLKMKN